MEVADVAGTDMPSTGTSGTGQADPESPQAQQVAITPAGQRHMALNVLAVVTIVLGLVSFALGMIVRNETSASAALHVTATVTGAIAIILGLYIQMISATRTERIIVVTGMIAGFVGACLGLAHGGFSG
jgi:ammonia channel protein AmtB